MDANSKTNDRNAQIASERVRFHHKLKILLGRWRDEMNAKPLTAASTPPIPRGSLPVCTGPDF
jgi:hypothetical protein